MHRALVLVLSLTLTSCLTTQQQQERQKLCMDKVAQMNKELTEREYATHTKQRDDDFAEFKSKLAMARSGLIARERGDCCCTGAELPPVKTVKLSKTEFDSMMGLLHQALPVPLLDRKNVHSDYLYCATRTEEGEWTTRLKRMPVNVIMKPYWPVDRLNLLDEKGECVLSLSLYSAFDKASNAEKYTSRDYDRYCLKALLPDAAYELFLKHPARLRFKKAAEKAERAAERS